MMRRPLTRQEAADLIEQTTAALLDAIPRDAADNPAVMGAAIGALAGSIAQASDNPEMMLGSIIQVAKGIMDGSLVDE